ncbi:hypothetical protein NMY22_g14276 [Coprinellus aureogranulatus]|nr:hypothetical protein NMY22_g14276 [Coprinellus aureogranulatus]
MDLRDRDLWYATRFQRKSGTNHTPAMSSGSRRQQAMAATGHKTKPFISPQFDLDMSHLKDCPSCRYILNHCGVSELALPEVYAHHAETCPTCRRFTKDCITASRDSGTSEDLTEPEPRLKKESALEDLKEAVPGQGGNLNLDSEAPKCAGAMVKEIRSMKQRQARLQFQVMLLLALQLCTGETSALQLTLLVALFWWTSDTTIGSVVAVILLMMGWQWLSTEYR